MFITAGFILRFCFLKNGGIIMESKTKMLTRSAVMIALAVALSFFAVVKLPNGGSITIGSLVPIILVSYWYDIKWALATSLIYSIIQMALGFYPPPVQNFSSFLLVILLDYVIAFSVLGLAGTIAKKIKDTSLKLIIGSTVVLFMRFLCHFLSGVTIWSSYAEGKNVFLFSFLYNGSYMAGELIITLIIMTVLSKLDLFKKSIDKN